MKLVTLALATLALAGVAVTAPAVAQRNVVVEKTVTHTTSYGPDHHRQRVCHKRWYHHHRVTRCYWR